MTTPVRVNTAVLADAFRYAILSDLSAEHDEEELDRWLSEASVHQSGNTATTPKWATIRDAVIACTRQMRVHAYYPESVLVAIKSAARIAADGLVLPQLVNELVSDAAQTCIATYFEPEMERKSTLTSSGGVVIPLGARTPGGNLPSTSLERRL